MSDMVCAIYVIAYVNLCMHSIHKSMKCICRRIRCKLHCMRPLHHLYAITYTPSYALNTRLHALYDMRCMRHFVRFFVHHHWICDDV